jgi:DNA topoisomerase-1
MPIIVKTLKQTRKVLRPKFTTSSIQQEGARKFGFTVDRTMQILQKCYEQGWTTYMRTDSVSMSQEALDGAKNEIINLYGKNYSNPKQFQSKKENAANAHECIRPTHFENQTVEGTDDEKRCMTSCVEPWQVK